MDESIAWRRDLGRSVRMYNTYYVYDIGTVAKDNGMPFLSLISRCTTVSRVIASLMLEMDGMREDKIRFKESVKLHTDHTSGRVHANVTCATRCGETRRGAGRRARRDTGLRLSRLFAWTILLTAFAVLHGVRSVPALTD